MKAPCPAPSELQIRLVNRMAQHLGRDKGISADALALALQISPRRLRRLISQTRLQGVAICGKPATGYYMPETADELAFVQNLVHYLAKAYRTPDAFPKLLDEGGRLLPGPLVVAADEHRRARAAEVGVHHERVADARERLHEARARHRLLQLLHQGLVRSGEESDDAVLGRGVPVAAGHDVVALFRSQRAHAFHLVKESMHGSPKLTL